MKSERHANRPIATAAWHAPAWGAILAVAVVAACNESMVAPPPAIEPASASSALPSLAPASERDILIALYEATDGRNWVNSENWLTDAPLGEWYGVRTDASGRVIRLNLSGRWDGGEQRIVLHGLSGPIPSELGGLANLQQLSLGPNELSGPIPSELGGLANLQQLYLYSNELSGPIPSELGGLANLQRLYLSGNRLTGTVPPSFLQLSQLQGFGFAGNAGLCLPADLVAWYEGIEEREGPVCPDAEVLQALYETAGGEGWTNADGWLGDGPLGEWYGVGVDASGRVSTVDLEGNGLSGILPDELGNLAGLTTLRMGDNALSGRLPSSLSRVSLRELRYANTDLCTPVEASFQEWLAALPQHEGTGVQCPPLSDREILAVLFDETDGPNWRESGNWLTDAPLGEWHGVDADADGKVVSLDLQRNGLEGPIPPELGGLAELDTLILFLNQLTGSIPPALGGLAKAKLVVLAGNRLSGPIPPELGGLADVEALWLNGNQLASAPAELGGLPELRVLSLAGNQLTSVPPELGGLPELRELWLNGNQLASVPGELGELGHLRVLNLTSNRLTSVPAELGGLANLEYLGLGSNELTSVPPELGGLGNLRVLDLDENRLASLPSELGRLERLGVLWLASNELTSVPLAPGGFASLSILDLSSNEFTSFPWELGQLGNLRILELDGNRLTDIPPGFGRGASAKRLASHATELPSFSERWSESDHPWRLDSDEHQLTFLARNRDKLGTLRARMELDGNQSSPAMRSRVGSFASLETLDLSSNELSGSLPAGLLGFTGLTSLGLADNAGLTGALPFGLTALERIEDLHTTGTDLCAPADPTFLDWLEGVTRQRVAHCGRGGDAAAYLTQVVQSREFPVPLVAGEPALLRVFVTAERATAARMPPVRATFYRDGAVTYEADIPGTSDPIPPEIDESSLSKSANLEIPGWVIQPGLEVVIEPDPEGMLDPALGVAGRIPATGRMAVDVHAMPVFELTLVPFLWDANPDASILETTAAMAGDPEGHELFEQTHLLLPVSAMDVTAHGSVLTSTNNGFRILEETEMIRVAEGGRGHYLGVMAGPTGPDRLLGVANNIGSWSSFSVLDSETIAHEFGHNRNLYHAPCGGAGGPDRYYPYGAGNIGAWGYDPRTGDLVPPGRPDFMSYCEPTWTSDYQFTNALRYRLETESNSILVTAAARAASSGRTLLIWGGLDGAGAPYLRPAFFIDAPPTLPSTGGAWSLTGRDPGGAELFSLSFAMAKFTDSEDDRAGFSFALPVTWTEELASISVQGPRGSASLDRDTHDPITILRDPATRRIRGILDGTPPAALASGLAAVLHQALEVLFSRGIPDAAAPGR